MDIHNYNAHCRIQLPQTSNKRRNLGITFLSTIWDWQWQGSFIQASFWWIILFMIYSVGWWLAQWFIPGLVDLIFPASSTWMAVIGGFPIFVTIWEYSDSRASLNAFWNDYNHLLARFITISQEYTANRNQKDNAMKSHMQPHIMNWIRVLVGHLRDNLSINTISEPTRSLVAARINGYESMNPLELQEYTSSTMPAIVREYIRKDTSIPDDIKSEIRSMTKDIYHDFEKLRIQKDNRIPTNVIIMLYVMNISFFLFAIPVIIRDLFIAFSLPGIAIFVYYTFGIVRTTIEMDRMYDTTSRSKSFNRYRNVDEIGKSTIRNVNRVFSL